MLLVLFHASVIYVKRGERVEAEAAALGVARHPGVVELVGVVDGALHTVRVEGRSLSELPPLADDEVAGVTAAVATTLADLHGLGMVHGGVEAAHVLVAADGRIVLCSLGRGGDPADDIAALGSLVTGLLASAPPDAAPAAVPPTATGWWSRWSRSRRRPARLGSLLAPPARPALEALAAQAVDPDPARRPTARQLAAAVHQRVPTARLPAVPPGGPALPLPPTHPSPRRVIGRRARTVATSGLAVVVVVVALSVVGRVAGGGRPDREAASAPLTADAPRTTASVAPGDSVAERIWPEPPVVYADGVLEVDGVRYAVGGPGDAVVAGDWGCRGRRTAALLRPTSGEVFAFDDWAHAGADVTGRPLGVVEGAAGLRVTDSDGDGCDDLEVDRNGRPPVRIPVGS